MGESLQDNPGAPHLWRQKAEGYHVWMCLKQKVHGGMTWGRGWSPDGQGEMAQTHTPEGLRHWPGMSQLEKAGHGLGHSSQPSLLTMSTHGTARAEIPAGKIIWCLHLPVVINHFSSWIH